MERRLKIRIVSVVAVVSFLLVVWLATEPFRLSEGEIPIDRKTRWIEVSGETIVFSSYVAEGSPITRPWDFPEPYISEITVYLIWIDDPRTEPDTFLFMVRNGTDEQKIAAGGNGGEVYMTTPLPNNDVRHIDNSEGWSIEVTCQEARDGYLFPGGIITIPDDGNQVDIRIEYKFYKEHNPDWL